MFPPGLLNLQNTSLVLFALLSILLVILLNFSSFKDLISLIINGIQFLIFKFKKKKYIERVWNPFQQAINQKLIEFYSPTALDEEVEVIVSKGISTPHILDGKLMIFISDEELKQNSLFDNNKANILSTMRILRTNSYRNHIPDHLKKAIDIVADNEIAQDLGISRENMIKKDNNIVSTEDIQAVEDVYYAGFLQKFLSDVKKEFGNSRVSVQTQYKVLLKFKNYHNKILKRPGGVIKIVSNKEWEYYIKGARAFFIQSDFKTSFPHKIDDWNAFFLKKEGTNKLEIVGIAVITDVIRGEFQELFDKYFNLLKIPGLSYSEVKRLYKNWVKGLGGTKRKKKKGKQTEGSALDIFLIKIKELTEVEIEEIPKDLQKAIFKTGFISKELNRKLRKMVLH